MANSKKQAVLNESLIDAALYGLLGDLKEAIEKGADVNARDEIDNTALIWAASTNQNKILKYLLEKKADPNVKNRIGWTPLICAANNNNFEGIKKLVKLKIDINITDNNNMSALMFAALKDYIDTVNILLDNGADVNILDSNNQNALFYAIDNHPADLVNKSNDEEESEINNYNDEKISLIEKLIEKGTDLSVKNAYGNTCFFFAIEKENIPAIKLLLSKNASLDVINKNNKNVLDMAFETENIKIEQMIVKAIKDAPGLNKLKNIIEEYIKANRLSDQNLFKDTVKPKKVVKKEAVKKVETKVEDKKDNKDKKEKKILQKKKIPQKKKTEKKEIPQNNYREIQKKSFLGESMPINVVEGKVDYVSSNDVIIEYVIKSRSRVSIDEFDPNNLPQKGDQILTYIEQIQKGGEELVISRQKAMFLMHYNKLEKIYKKKKSVVGTFVKVLEKGMEISLNGITSFLPQKEYNDYLKNNDLIEILGKNANFKITKLSQKNHIVHVSRKKAYREELADKRKLLKKKLEAEVELRGEVKEIKATGVKVDLGGIDGFIHISDMPEELVSLEKSFKIKQSINVKVVGYDQQKDILFLSLKQELPKSWDYIVSKYSKGSKVKGEVVNFAKFGAFVELEPGLNGLVHISEMSWTKRIDDPKKFLEKGQKIEAVVTKISHELEQINISIKRVSANPWLSIDEKYPLNSVVKKKIVSVSSFGVFVSLEDDIEGLIHVNDLFWSTFEFDPKYIFKIGDEIETQVLTIDKPFHRIVLSKKHLKDDPWDSLKDDELKDGDEIEIEVLYGCQDGLVIQHKINDDLSLDGYIFSEDIVDEDVEEPFKLFAKGEKLTAKISRIDYEDHSFVLSLVDYFAENPENYSKFLKEKKIK